jgi:hypothetical protein
LLSFDGGTSVAALDPAVTRSNDAGSLICGGEFDFRRAGMKSLHHAGAVHEVVSSDRRDHLEDGQMTRSTDVMVACKTMHSVMRIMSPNIHVHRLAAVSAFGHK